MEQEDIREAQVKHRKDRVCSDKRTNYVRSAVSPKQSIRDREQFVDAIDRAEKRLRMSRNCSEKLGDTRAFCYSFAIELLLRGQFSASVQV